MLAAAQASLQAGAFDAGLGLLATAETTELDAFQHARVELLRGQVAFASGLFSDAPPLLLTAARLLEPVDMELARDTYLNAWSAAILVSFRFGEEGTLTEICSAVRALPPPLGAPRPVDLVLDGLALLFTDGHAAAAATFKRAAKVLTSLTVDDLLGWGWTAATVAFGNWDLASLHAITVRHVQLQPGQRTIRRQ